MVNAAATGLAERVKAQAAQLGFAACGIAPADDDPLPAARLEAVLGQPLPALEPYRLAAKRKGKA